MARRERAWSTNEVHSGTLLLLSSLILYGLLNWCYTVAVFTDPGSPVTPISGPSFSRHNYSHLPTVEPPRDSDSITVKSTGGQRFCKKCQTKKPDRAHHCSTCGRCVLKMDHHCPWLATCVGLRNYKPFLLFCGYVTVFCWVCFITSAGFVWGEVVSNELAKQHTDFAAVNTVLLAVISGIFGLVLAGFTGWHLSLAVRNQTTIECLEKTRYLNPIRRTMDRAAQAFPSAGREAGENFVQRYGHQLAEIHANSIPGVTRAEEGEERASPHTRLAEFASHGTEPHPGRPVISAAQSLQQNYSQLERRREVDRYESYLDEQDSEKLPHAFDLGWRRNLTELFGQDWRFWVLPICNTLGDGWNWETSARWAEAQQEQQAKREARAREQELEGRAQREQEARMGWGAGHHTQPNGRLAGGVYEGPDVPMRPMGKAHDDDTSSVDGLYAHDDDEGERAPFPRKSRDEWRDWD